MAVDVTDPHSKRDPGHPLVKEITELRAKVAKLRAALEVVTATDDHADPEVRATVRAALKETAR
jgi:hypothetical protein